MQLGSNVKASWLPGDQSLVDWFMTMDLPMEPFYLEEHQHIIDPVKFFQLLREEIQTGPTGPRAKKGTLQDDLYKIRAYFSHNGLDAGRISQTTKGANQIATNLPLIIDIG